jgi:DNA-binding GntR family transcriptional regulator
MPTGLLPQSATRVSLIDIGKARQTQFLRRALELEAVEILSTAPDKSVVHVLRDLVARQKAAAERADLSGFDQLDQEFHARIFEAAAFPTFTHSCDCGAVTSIASGVCTCRLPENRRRSSAVTG